MLNLKLTWWEWCTIFDVNDGSTSTDMSMPNSNSAKYKRVESGQHSMAWLRAWTLCVSAYSYFIMTWLYVFVCLCSKIHAYMPLNGMANTYTHTCMHTYTNQQMHTYIYNKKCNAIHRHIPPHRYNNTYNESYDTIHTYNAYLYALPAYIWQLKQEKKIITNPNRKTEINAMREQNTRNKKKN